MVVKQVITSLGLVVALVLGTACSKPSEDDCRKALSNMQSLLGTEYISKNSDIQGEVRRCKGGSSRKAVACAIAADRKSTRLNSSHLRLSRMPSSA